jgi:hypothetical protein
MEDLTVDKIAQDIADELKHFRNATPYPSGEDYEDMVVEIEGMLEDAGIL